MPKPVTGRFIERLSKPISRTYRGVAGPANVMLFPASGNSARRNRSVRILFTRPTTHHEFSGGTLRPSVFTRLTSLRRKRVTGLGLSHAAVVELHEALGDYLAKHP